MPRRISFWSLTAYVLGFWFVNTFTLFIHNGAYSWQWIYHSFILTVLAAFSLSLTKKEKFNHESIRWAYLITIFLCLGIFIFITYKSYHFPNVWLDEYTQLIRGLGDPAIESMDEQQPPGSYALTKFLRFFFDVNKNAVRLTGFIPLTLALGFFLVLGARVSSFIPFTIIFMSYFLTDPDVRYLSLEGRPVGLGVSSFAVVLLSIAELFKRPSKLALLYVLATSYIFLTSVGLQPILLLGYFSILSITLLLVTKNKELLFLTKALLLSLFAFFPLQLSTLLKASELKKFHVSFYKRFYYTINKLNIDELLIYILPDTYSKVWPYFFLIALAASLFIIKRSRKKSSLFLILLFVLSFPIVFHFSYYTIINWDINRWYYGCYLILAALLSCLAISNLTFLKLNWILSPIVALLIFANQDTREFYMAKVANRPSWERLYKKIKVETPQRIYTLGFCNGQTWWCYNFFVGAEMWNQVSDDSLRGMNGNFTISDYLQDNGMIYDSQNLKEKVHVSIVILARETLYEFQEILSLKDSPYKISSYENFLIVETKEPVFISHEISRVLPWLSNHLSKSEDSFFPYSLLVWDYANKGNLKESTFWYQKLLELPKLKENAENHPLGQQILDNLEKLTHSKKVQN